MSKQDKNTQKPAIRFRRFTHAWERRKLGEVVGILKSYPLSRNVETEVDTGTKYIHYGDIHRGILSIIQSMDNLPFIENGKYEYLNKYDLVLADASEDYQGIATPCVIECNIKEKIVSGLHTIALRPIQANHLFLYYLLYTDKFKGYCRVVGTGIKVFGISAKRITDFESVFPNIEEQTAIGDFFRRLDRLITLHQRKAKLLQNLRKILLNRMLP